MHGNAKLYKQIENYEETLALVRRSIQEIQAAEDRYGLIYGNIKKTSVEEAASIETLIHDLRMAIK